MSVSLLTHYFHGAACITELLVIPQYVSCKHLHDLTGARTYMAGIYEKHAAIKIILFKEAEKRGMTVPLLSARDRLKGG